MDARLEKAQLEDRQQTTGEECRPVAAIGALIGEHDIDWHWVKGHSGHRENEIADQLANRGIDEL